MAFWEGKQVIVTGGSGFVGRHLVRLLRDKGADVFVPNARNFDLTRKGEVARLFFERRFRGRLRETPVDVVFHLAATVGGIGANARHPAKFLYENATMNLFVANEALSAGAKKFVAVGSVCAYPKHCPAPFCEDDLFNGYPEETNAPYGLTKRLLLVYLQSLRDQYGFHSAMVFPTNMYGPGDHFGSRDAHVIPMLIDRFIAAKEAGDDVVTIWGTGQATRDFLHVQDAVRGIEAAARLYDGPDPINLGTGTETSILELAATIGSLVGFTGSIETDPSKPDGQPTRVLDIGRARRRLDWTPRIPLAAGLAETIEWYLESKK